MKASPTKKRRRVAAISAALRGAQHVAIVRLGSIGDVVATIPLAWFLRDLLGPDIGITWIVHSASADLLRGVRAVDEIVSIPKGSLLTAVSSWRSILADRQIDAVIDVHGNLKSGIVSRLSGAHHRVGFHRRDCREHWNPLFSNLKLPPLESRNKTRRAVEIARLLGHPHPAPRFELEFDAEEREHAKGVLASLDCDHPLAVVQLGREEDVRSWPPENYARVSELLIEAGYSVLILGGPPEERTGQLVRDRLADAPRRLHFEVNTMTLRQVGAVLSAAAGRSDHRSVFVGGDSGCLHLAAGCGLRSIGLFGPQDPQRTAPIGDHVEILYRPELASCIPCARRECFHQTWSFCMKSIAADEVVERIVAPAGAATFREASPRAGGTADTAPSEARRLDHHLEARSHPGPRPRPAPATGIQWTWLWTLIATTTILALRAAHGAPLPAAGQFPGLGRLIEPTGWLGSALSVLAGSGLAVSAYLMARRLGTPSTGVLAANLLAASALFLDVGRMTPGDGLFALLVNLSFLLLLEGEVGVGARRRWCGPLATAVAFTAFLVKGALGVLLPAFAMITFRAGEKALGALLRPRTLISAALVVAGIAASYFVMRPPVDGTSEFRTAFFEPLTSTDAAPPIWAYVNWLLIGCLPAAALAPFALLAHLRNRRYREDLGFADRRWRYAKSVLSGFVLLSLLPMKSPLFLIALLPALSVLVAAWLEKRWEEMMKDETNGSRLRFVTRLAVLLAALALAGITLQNPGDASGSARWTPPLLFVIGSLIASRVAPTTPSGLSLRVLLIAVVTAAALG